MPKIAQNSAALHTSICDALPFDTYGNLSGDTVSGSHQVGHGILPRMYRDLLRAFGPTVDYVVYSYATPVAWRITVDETVQWIIPDVKYSVTTSKAQGRVRYALHNVNNVQEV